VTLGPARRPGRKAPATWRSLGPLPPFCGRRYEHDQLHRTRGDRRRKLNRRAVVFWDYEMNSVCLHRRVLSSSW
jgi:hypothetical protein